MQYQTDWQCKRCGSTERRNSRPTASRSSRSTGCAECHRRRSREKRHGRTLIQYPGLTHLEALVFTRLLEDDFTDVEVTGAGRAYLAAFTRFLAAVRDGDSRAALEARDARERALNRLED